MDNVQQSVKQQMDRGVADLTKNNTALVDLVRQLERLQGEQQPAGGVCAKPCLDLGEYPMLHSSACICAHHALAHMHNLAARGRYLGTVAIAGMLFLTLSNNTPYIQSRNGICFRAK